MVSLNLTVVEQMNLDPAVVANVIDSLTNENDSLRERLAQADHVYHSAVIHRLFYLTRIS